MAFTNGQFMYNAIHDSIDEYNLLHMVTPRSDLSLCCLYTVSIMYFYSIGWCYNLYFFYFSIICYIDFAILYIITLTF